MKISPRAPSNSVEFWLAQHLLRTKFVLLGLPMRMCLGKISRIEMCPPPVLGTLKADDPCKSRSEDCVTSPPIRSELGRPSEPHSSVGAIETLNGLDHVAKLWSAWQAEGGPL